MRRFGRLVVGFALASLALAVGAAGGAERSQQAAARGAQLARSGSASRADLPRHYVFGRSVKGRALRAVRVGDADAKRVALLVGQIHGDEPQGRRVVRRFHQRYADIKGVAVWIVSTMNPDGAARHQRKNARDVDLNRNFGVHWRGGVPHSNGYYPGPHSFSEPESRAVRRFVKRIRPDVSIWYHQPWGQVLGFCHTLPNRVPRRYSRLSGVPFARCHGAALPGTAIRWQNKRVGGTAFVVELHAGRLSSREVRRNARAARLIAKG